MDPRHPEQAISRMRDLMEQYDRIEKDMQEASTSAGLAELEREGSLVVQEICLVAPRIHEAMMQTSRQRRHDLTHGVVITMSKYKVPDGASGEEAGVVEKPAEKQRSEALAEIANQTEKIREQVSEIVDTVTEEVKKTVEKSEPVEIASEGAIEVIEAAKENSEAEKKAAKKTTKKKTTKKAKK